MAPSHRAQVVRFEHPNAHEYPLLTAELRRACCALVSDDALGETPREA